MQLVKHQSGFAMIEVMVTVVIIAIGISGMGLLLLRALQGTQDSAQLSQAMWIVQDYVGRIRANPDGARGGFYRMDSNNINCTTDIPTLLCADTYKQTGGINTTGSLSPSVDCSVNPAVNPMAKYDTWASTCSFHSGLASLYDSPSNFIASKRLEVTCIQGTKINTFTNEKECIEYTVTLSWKTKTTKESTVNSERTYDNEYSAVVGLN